MGAPGCAGRAVLVVDDDTAVLHLLRRLVESFGFAVLSAETATAGLELFLRHTQAVDLAIIDLTLPDMDGAELAALLWDARPALRILFATGHDEAALPRTLHEDERVGFIQKPYRVHHLASRVSALTGQPVPDHATAV